MLRLVVFCVVELVLKNVFVWVVEFLFFIPLGRD
jgi:hypothetical protein